MREDANLEAAQQSDDYDPIATLHYWDGAQWVDLNSSDQLMEILRTDLPYSGQGHIELDNSDGLLDTLDLNGKMIRMGFGSTGIPPDTTVYMSYLPYLWGEGWGNGLSMDGMPKVLFAQGPWEKLEGYILKENHTTFAGDGTTSDAIYQMTIAEMIDWICQEAGLGWFDGTTWTPGLATAISDDGNIGVWAPFYIMYAGQNGKQIVKALLELTQCLLVPFEGTFKVKKLDGTEAGVYTYSDITPHYFESCQHEKHVWKPMKVQVLGPITYVHNIPDAVHTVSATDASDHATFAALAREIKDYFWHHTRNDPTIYHPSLGDLSVDADLPHLAEDVTNTVTGSVPTDITTLLGLMVFSPTLLEIRDNYNAHRASTTYHLAEDANGTGSRLYHEDPVYDNTNELAEPDADDWESVANLINELSTNYNDHLTFGGHNTADTANDYVPPYPLDPESEAWMVAAVQANTFKAKFNAHREQAFEGPPSTWTFVHYEDDEYFVVDAADAGLSYPGDEASLYTLANQLKAMFNGHIFSANWQKFYDLANECKVDFNAHFLNTDAHVVADGLNAITADDATTGTTLATLAAELQADINLHLLHPETYAVAMANELQADINAHFIEVGVHIIDDTTNTIPGGPATTFANSYTLVNAVKVGFNAHLIFQSENSGTYTHADWTSDMGMYVWRDIFGLATTNAIALALATAIVLRAEMESDKGSIVTQGMNCLQEIFDVVSIGGDVAGVYGTERIGGLRWYWQPLDGYCYQVLTLGGVEYNLASNDNWMAEDLRLLQDQMDQSTAATVPVAPTAQTLLSAGTVAKDTTWTQDYPLERGFLYMASVTWSNPSGDDSFTIEAAAFDSTHADHLTPVGGTRDGKCPGGDARRSFVFYSGNTAGASDPHLTISLENFCASETTFTVTLTLIKLS